LLLALITAVIAATPDDPVAQNQLPPGNFRHIGSGAQAGPAPAIRLPASSLRQVVHEGHAGATKASGTVDTVDTAKRKITVSHGAIKSLGRNDYGFRGEIGDRSQRDQGRNQRQFHPGAASAAGRRYPQAAMTRNGPAAQHRDGRHEGDRCDNSCGTGDSRVSGALPSSESSMAHRPHFASSATCAPHAVN
jgi:hypothetical protein